jgi:hypothetical protein
MKNSMKIHVYKVISELNTPDLKVVLNYIEALPLDQRLRSLGKEQQEIRAENIKKPTSSLPYWLIDFTRLRFDHGPGKVNRNTPIEDFNLNNDEGFGEETAALYDESSGYLFIQYNHFGVRSGSIATYLNDIRTNQNDVYSLHVKMDGDSEVRLARTNIIKKLNFKIAPVNMSTDMRQAGVSVDRILKLSDELNAETIEVTISSGKSGNSNLLFGKVSKVINALKEMMHQDDRFNNSEITPRALQKFEVYGKKELDSITEEIDMISPKLEYDIDGLVLGEGKRFTQESRWGALIRARRGCTFLNENN